MKQFEIVIEEIIRQEFEIYADTAEEAIELAMSKYKMGEFVLTSGEVQHKKSWLLRSLPMKLQSRLNVREGYII